MAFFWACLMSRSDVSFNEHHAVSPILYSLPTTPMMYTNDFPTKKNLRATTCWLFIGGYLNWENKLQAFKHNKIYLAMLKKFTDTYTNKFFKLCNQN